MNGYFLCLAGTLLPRRRCDRALFPLRSLLSPPILFPSPEIHAPEEAPLRLRLFQFRPLRRSRRPLPQRRFRRNARSQSRSGAAGVAGAANGVVDDGGTGAGDYDARAQLLGLSESLSPFYD